MTIRINFLRGVEGKSFGGVVEVSETSLIIIPGGDGAAVTQVHAARKARMGLPHGSARLLMLKNMPGSAVSVSMVMMS